jgi:hypothetical protein
LKPNEWNNLKIRLHLEKNNDDGCNGIIMVKKYGKKRNDKVRTFSQVWAKDFYSK